MREYCNRCTIAKNRNSSDPANRISVDGPQLVAIGVCRHIRVDQSDYGENGNHPTVAAGFAHSGAQISTGEERDHRQREQHHHERDQCRA